MSRDLCVWWNRKSRPQVVCKKTRREFRPGRSHFSKQTGRTVPSESERSIENLARVPSMQTVVFWCAPAAQYAADAKAVSKNGEHSVHTNDCFAQCIGHTVHSEPESCLEKIRELRPCRTCSMQLTQELSQKNGESSVHTNHDFSYLRRLTLQFISIRQRKHKA